MNILYVSPKRLIRNVLTTKRKYVDEGCSADWDPVLIYYRNTYWGNTDWGTAHTNDASKK